MDWKSHISIKINHQIAVNPVVLQPQTHGVAPRSFCDSCDIMHMCVISVRVPQVDWKSYISVRMSYKIVANEVV